MDGGSEDASGIDASFDSASTVVCARDEDCADDLFCNGDERCEPGRGDARGCLASDPPCIASEICQEAESLCRPVDCSTPDADGDGSEAIACGGNDCDDDDPRVYGTATEVCDPAGLDEDCDPDTIHNTSAGMNDGDRDGDGYIDARCFNRTTGSENRGTDCDDTRPTINPDGVESCNGFDDDCDGSLDEGVRLVFYRDVDGDGYGLSSDTLEDCSRPTGYALMPDDCDDGNPAAHPGGSEICGGADEDCDSIVDEEGATGTTIFYRDVDGDTYGDTTDTVAACSAPAGFVERAGDCWDGAALVHPGAEDQGEPYCRIGSLCGGPGMWRCSTEFVCRSSAPIDWDYNCNGIVEVDQRPWTPCSGGGSSVCIASTGPTRNYTAAECGQSVRYYTGCGGSGGCSPVTADRPLRCR